MKMNMGLVLCMGLISAACAAHGRDNVNFNYSPRPGLAGYALLSEDGYLVNQSIGVANFSPELRLPVQLVYSSASDRSGLFGHGWHCPQLESSVSPEKEGLTWTTPWGEQISFISKKVAAKSFLDLFKEEAKGSRDLFSPHADWEADSVQVRNNTLMDCTILGKRDYQGWSFTYRAAKLITVQAPSGRTLVFAYTKEGLLTSVAQDGVAFIEIAPSEGICKTLKVNGLNAAFSYATEKVPCLPSTLKGRMTEVARVRMTTMSREGLAPLTFAYDAAGYLSEMRHGTALESFEVQHETLADRMANIKAAADRKAVHSGKVAGRLLSDSSFTYSYGGTKPGNVNLTSKSGTKATYDFNPQTGVLAVTDFSGLKKTYFYYMRYDVAYLGMLRQVTDHKGRVVTSYRYDRQTGHPTRIRDIVGNDVNLNYGSDGEIESVTRRAASGRDPEPVLRVRHDAKGNPVEIARLDANGRTVVTTKISYDAQSRPVRVDDGRGAMTTTYNAFGYPVQMTDRFGLTSSVEYDAYNRIASATAPNGVKTRYTWNAAGLMTAIARSDANGVLTSVSVAYDEQGRPVRYTDQSGRVKEFERDAFGRVVKELMPDETAVAYAYTADGRLSSVLDPEGRELRFDWSRFGLDTRTTGEGQASIYERDTVSGLLKAVVSRAEGEKKADRAIRYTYDGFDRMIKADYGNNQIETLSYDDWGRVTAVIRGDRKATCAYDYFGRLVKKTDGDIEETYAYNAYGQRTARMTSQGDIRLEEKRGYDAFGRLISISSQEGKVDYVYNDKNQLVSQTVNGRTMRFTYTPWGQLERKALFGASGLPLSTLEYFYGRDGAIQGRAVDGKLQRYSYDARGQLVAVLDGQGKKVEEYVYDKSGNILKKSIDGKVTEFTYDKANQLVSSICDGKRTAYHYDAAGRLVREGEKTYTYGYLDKVLGLRDGKATTTYDYTIAGQLASLTTRNALTTGNSEPRTDFKESFLWDGLALIRRGGVNYLNEPHAGGGAALLAGDNVMFNDVLGTTLGTADKQDTFAGNRSTAFGEGDTDALFTGKPYVEGLGHAFLLRNYRADLGKWQTADPLGHPDGWNNFAYCNGRVTSAVDWMGGYIIRCCDVNNNSAEVYSPGDLTVNLTSSGSDFTMHNSYCNKTSSGDLIITFNISLNMLENLEYDSNIPLGAVAGYQPHTALKVSTSSGDIPYEVIFAHEFAHASCFFDVCLSKFSNLIRGIDESASLETLASLCAIAYETASQETLYLSYWYANQATYGMFLGLDWNRDGYNQIGEERWVKRE